MAGDVYSAPPYVGRGGWSWYTGSAAWMQRAAIESIFGLSQRDDELSVEPCLPSAWSQAELRLTRAGKTVRILFTRSAAAPPALAAAASARLLAVGETRALVVPRRRGAAPGRRGALPMAHRGILPRRSSSTPAG